MGPLVAFFPGIGQGGQLGAGHGGGDGQGEGVGQCAVLIGQDSGFGVGQGFER